MKKILLLTLLIYTTLSAKTELKEGKYLWYTGGSAAYLTITKDYEKRIGKLKNRFEVFWEYK